MITHQHDVAHRISSQCPQPWLLDCLGGFNLQDMPLRKRGRLILTWLLVGVGIALGISGIADAQTTASGPNVTEEISTPREADAITAEHVQAELNAWLTSRNLLTQDSAIKLEEFVEVGRELPIPLRTPMAERLLAETEARHGTFGQMSAETFVSLTDALVGIDQFDRSRWRYGAEWVVGAKRWRELPPRLVLPAAAMLKHIKPEDWEPSFDGLATHFFEQVYQNENARATISDQQIVDGVIAFYRKWPQESQQALLAYLTTLLDTDDNAPASLLAAQTYPKLSRTLQELGMDEAKRKLLLLGWFEKGSPADPSWIGHQDADSFYHVLWELGRLGGSQDQLSALTSRWLNSGEGWRTSSLWQYGKTAWLLYGEPVPEDFRETALSALIDGVRTDTVPDMDYTVMAGLAKTINTDRARDQLDTALAESDGLTLLRGSAILATRYGYEGQAEVWRQTLRERVARASAPKFQRNLRLRLAVAEATASRALPDAHRLVDAVIEHFASANTPDEIVAGAGLVECVLGDADRFELANNTISALDSASLRRDGGDATAADFELIKQRVAADASKRDIERQQAAQERIASLESEQADLQIKLDAARLTGDQIEIKRLERALALLKSRSKRLTRN